MNAKRQKDKRRTEIRIAGYPEHVLLAAAIRRNSPPSSLLLFPRRVIGSNCFFGLRFYLCLRSHSLLPVPPSYLHDPNAYRALRYELPCLLLTSSTPSQKIIFVVMRKRNRQLLCLCHVNSVIARKHLINFAKPLEANRSKFGDLKIHER